MTPEQTESRKERLLRTLFSRGRDRVRTMMLDVIIALIPALGIARCV